MTAMKRPRMTTRAEFSRRMRIRISAVRRTRGLLLGRYPHRLILGRQHPTPRTRVKANQRPRSAATSTHAVETTRASPVDPPCGTAKVTDPATGHRRSSLAVSPQRVQTGLPTRRLEGRPSAINGITGVERWRSLTPCRARHPERGRAIHTIIPPQPQPLRIRPMQPMLSPRLVYSVSLGTPQRDRFCF